MKLNLPLYLVLGFLYSNVLGVNFFRKPKQHILILSKEAPLLNDAPLIGILTCPTEDHGISAIEKRYVNFIETSGGRVIPIDYNSTKEQIHEKFNQVNGILITGDGLSIWDPNVLFNDSEHLHPYFRSMKFLFDFAIEANDNGDYFPIFGIGSGFDFLMMMVSNEPFLFDLIPGNATANYLAKLRFMDNHSRLYSRMTPELIDALKTKDLTPNNHPMSVFNGTFYSHPALVKFFNVLTVSEDENGENAFVSSAEAKKYPFYGIQYHMEKANFLFSLIFNLDHSEEAIEVSQELANLFIQECKKNGHILGDYFDEIKADIHNYQVKYLKKEFSFIFGTKIANDDESQKKMNFYISL